MKKAKTLFTLVVIWAITAMGFGIAQAITLSEPGEALLVPGVNYDSALQVNTFVGITIPAMVGEDPLTGLPYLTAPSTSAPGGMPGIIPVPPAFAIHWFFFDENSVHQLDDGIAATLNDFVPLDWGAVVVAAGGGLDGVPGYLVITNEVARGVGLVVPANRGFAMYGDAAIVQGNWASAAYVPVVPMNDTTVEPAAPTIADNVIWAGGIVPAAVSPLIAGIQLDNDDGDNLENCVIDMRYFLDPALGGATDLVVWMDRNYGPPAFVPGYAGVAIEVYDTAEWGPSAAMDLNREVNWIDASTIPWTQRPVDADGLTSEGFIYIELPELTDGVFGIAAGPEGSCVAFSLLYFAGGGNPGNVQTALAHERGIF